MSEKKKPPGSYYCTRLAEKQRLAVPYYRTRLAEKQRLTGSYYRTRLPEKQRRRPSKKISVPKDNLKSGACQSAKNVCSGEEVNWKDFSHDGTVLKEVVLNQEPEILVEVILKTDFSQDGADLKEVVLNQEPENLLEVIPKTDFIHDGADLKEVVLNQEPEILLEVIPKTEKNCNFPTKASSPKRKRNDCDGPSEKPKSKYHKAQEVEFEEKADYQTLLALNDVDLVSNVEKFVCPICFLDVDVGEGVTLHECLHNFCKQCLAGVIQFSETPEVKCPFMNDLYSCEFNLQDLEIKSLVAPEVYEKHLQKSIAVAEGQAGNSFHCKTPDCPGWFLFEDNVNTFSCSVCMHTNCLTCAAIHEGKNCRQYQDDIAFLCETNEKARQTAEYLQDKINNGEAMKCPKCQIVIVKISGCDWIQCTMCHTEICWATKGPRWGPGGKGDISGGCKCKVNGIPCHPKCGFCH